MVFLLVVLLATMAGWYAQRLPVLIAPRRAWLRWLLWIVLALTGMYLMVPAGVLLYASVTNNVRGGLSAGGNAAWAFLLAMIAHGGYSWSRRGKAPGFPISTLVFPIALLILIVVWIVLWVWVNYLS